MNNRKDVLDRRWGYLLLLTLSGWLMTLVTIETGLLIVVFLLLIVRSDYQRRKNK